jgi:glycosyltransferase involved in cell wall biosynthesis
MNKKKVLFILHYPPPVHGSSVVGLQIKNSNKINTAFQCSYVNLGTSDTVDEIGKNALGKIARYLFILWKVLKSLLFFRPALCYFAITVEGIGFYKDCLVVFLVKLFRVPVVYHFHNKGISNRQERFFDNRLYRFAFKNSFVILLSPLLYPDARKYLASDKIFYCPNGVEPLAQVEQLNKKNLSAQILFLGNMIETKGVYVLLDACKYLKQKKIKFQCTFVGGWGNINEKQFREKVIENEIEPEIYYAGKKYGQEKEQLMNSADIFVLPTYYYNECFPLVLLEAMRAGLPVVSTFEGGIPDIVEDGITGFLVPQQNAAMLAEKLELLVNDEELRVTMGQKGRIRYQENFTSQRFETNMAAILVSCLNNVN